MRLTVQNMKVILYLQAIVVCLCLMMGNVAAQTVPTPDHVVVLVLENHGDDLIIGSPDAPYINSLATDSFGALFTNSHGVTHPSQPNYMYLFSGDNQNVILDFTPISLLLPFTSANLGASLLQAGKTFVGYSEDLPSVGYTGDNSGAYYRKHAPWVNWQGTGTNGIPAALNQPFTAFPSNYDNLPKLCFVIPNQDHDMHDGTIAQGDAWIQSNLGAYVQWARTHNSLLILTFDEDENLTGSNDIPTIFNGQMVKHGQYNELVDHNRVLRTMEDMYSLPYAGASANSSPIVDCWVYKPVSAFTGAPAEVCPGQTVNFVDSTLNQPTSTQWIFAGGTPGTATGTPPTVTYNTPGVYSVTLISANQMGADTLIKSNGVTVNPKPVVTFTSDTVAICTGDTAMITAHGAALYNWLPQTGLLYTGNSLMMANPAESTFYKVVGVQNGCASDTAGIQVEVDSVLATSFQLSPSADTTVCAGQTLVFNAQTTNGGNTPGYVWKLNGNTAISNSTTFSTLAFTNSYTVNCVFTSSATCATPASISSPLIHVTVEQAPVPVATAVDSALSCTAVGTYQWYLNGQAIDGATGQTYIALVSGSYTVAVTSAAGCTGLSTPVAVTMAVSGIENLQHNFFSVFPNPTTGEFVVQTTSALSGACNMQLIDLTGRLVYTRSFTPQSSQQQIHLQLPQTQAGAYLLVITNHGHSQTVKMFIQ